jgi:coenzyme PQQ precursor peptide PqqA
MKWETPEAIDLRFGMEITMYISNRICTGPGRTPSQACPDRNQADLAAGGACFPLRGP